MSLLLYADECLDARVTSGLRRRGVDVTTAADQELLGASDETHLQRAIALRRAIVTCDHDFLEMLHDRAEHPGLLFVLPETKVGDAIRAIVLVSEIYEQSE